VAGSLGDLGAIAFKQGDLDKAAMYFAKSLSISALLQPVSQNMAWVLEDLSVIALIIRDRLRRPFEPRALGK
jgi:hypothetical protein